MEKVAVLLTTVSVSSIGSYEVQVCCMQMQINQHDGICTL